MQCVYWEDPLDTANSWLNIIDVNNKCSCSFEEIFKKWSDFEWKKRTYNSYPYILNAKYLAVQPQA